ncbi:MAG: DUF2147 domain-containing protein [Bacteroidales bacterium]|nr:DUF2147 domain-containing protein [Bacteroidales bacterium]MDD2569996.1 DUF2147 domain-containing protein [Bacteroidales bacterium]MDD2812261.1 DUF2147 domain-containing protein [Bacteroidales bacterium]MDD3385454.1 DUF2147 domain-containing protein [Bacteroidales bacterium]MDD3871218.1 DUF2147 domain-containing protein [Bacteroidales bacterium]
MKKLQLTGLLVAALLFAGGQIFGQDVVGKWRTIDDETNLQKSIVQIWISGGKLYGKILETFDDDGVTPTDDTCDKCKGALKDKRIRGMVIISGLTRSDEVWKGKKGILDPGNGKFYDVKIWLEDSKTLTVRGSIGPIGRKQTWHRVIE